MAKIQAKRARFLLVAVSFAFALGSARPAFSAWLDGVKEIKIGETTYPIFPERELIEEGLPVREVPDEQNAAIEYVKAINLYVKPAEELEDIRSYVLGNVWIEEAEKLIPWLEKNAAVIEALRQGARKADCKFPVLGESGISIYQILLPHLSPMRELGRLLAVQGKYLESQKKYRDALDHYLLLGKMGYHTSRDLTLISGLLGIALDAISARAIESCVLRNRLDTATLNYLLKRLSAVGRSAENYRIAMSGERAFGLSGVDDLFDRPKQWFGLISGQGSGAPSLQQVLALAAGRSYGLRAILKADFRRYWNAMDKWNELPDHVAFRPENDVGDKILQDLPSWSLARTLLPALSRARASFVRMKAVEAILTAQVAAEIYRNKNNKYPDRISQLKQILGELPLDPFTNEPLKYKRTEDGYLVYSVNEDLRDDGGTGSQLSGPDLVGRYPLPEPKPFQPSDSGK